MASYILSFNRVDKTKLAIVGGKGVNLGMLSKIEGIKVPDGFCISTEAFKKALSNVPLIKKLLDQLTLLATNDRSTIRDLSAEIRRRVEKIAIPEDIDREVSIFLSELGENEAYVVRSSATAEDLPSASFAGQHDSYLNIIGKEAILKHISKCWASLFTERAVTYRIQNGFDHRKVQLSVIIQKMVFPDVAGVVFTADPLTSNRKTVSIDASFGLGEGLVSGRVNTDNYKVYAGKLIDKKISCKELAIYAQKNGGTKEQQLGPEFQNRQALSDKQIFRIEKIGRKIEAKFGQPQDIEWCLVEDTFYIVQSRPITTLFPIPEAKDRESHVYLSVGHQQMMTAPMKPLGLSIFELTSFGPRFKAGGRLFVDVTAMLYSPTSRKSLMDTFGRADPLMKDALMTIIERGDFIKSSPDDKQSLSQDKRHNGITSPIFKAKIEDDPTLVYNLIKNTQTSVEELKHNIQTKSGWGLFNFILEDILHLKTILFDPGSLSVINAAMDATTWINEKMQEWLGQKNVADTLSQSVPNNITSEMGLELLDVADVIRPYPEVIEYLQHVKGDNFLEDLVKLNGGVKTRDAIHAYLNKYGMRCAGEIDITKARWSEKPFILVPMILNNIKNFEPNASNRKFGLGRKEALKKKQELLDRLKQLPGGEQKVKETKRVIDLIRNLIGYREYPKYGMVSRYFVYKQALLKEAEELVRAEVIQDKEDIYYLTFEELREVVRTKQLDYQIINKRRAEDKFYEKLTPPRVITSDGEILTGEYKRENIRSNALIGVPVSRGIVEGRARVTLNMEDADFDDGDILITSFTDPSWTPLFLSIRGLVTEVGGLMTHGAVIAREYGLPAVVGVQHATSIIKDGQRIRLNGTDGYIEIL